VRASDRLLAIVLLKRPVGTGLWPPLPRSSPAVDSGDDGKTVEDVDDDDVAG